MTLLHHSVNVLSDQIFQNVCSSDNADGTFGTLELLFLHVGWAALLPGFTQLLLPGNVEFDKGCLVETRRESTSTKSMGFDVEGLKAC